MSTPTRRAEYLALRRDGRTHAEACGDMGLWAGDATPQRYRRWWEAESGESDSYAAPDFRIGAGGGRLPAAARRWPSC